MPEQAHPVLTPAGLKNPRVQEFLAVKRHPGSRGHAGPVTLDGAWMIGQALAAGMRLHAVFICPALLDRRVGPALARQAVGTGAEGYEVSEKVFARLAGRDGMAALGHASPQRLADIRVGRHTRVVIADGWDLPGNLGTLIRCADGAGASGVLVIEQGFRLSHPLVVRASMGAALTMPVIAAGRLEATRWLQERGFRIVAADPAAGRSYRDADYQGPLAIVVGSERHGVAREWLVAADVTVAIPMLGSCDSLNAAVAGALLLYQALAQDGN